MRGHWDDWVLDDGMMDDGMDDGMVGRWYDG